MLLLLRARELDRHLPAARAGDQTGIHRARVASRRLREAVPVVAAPSRVRRKVERDIRRLTRALGAVRELDVALAVLDELAGRRAVPRHALEDVRAHVIAKRERRRARMHQKLDRVDADKLKRRLTELGGMVPELDLHDWRGVLDTRITRRARMLGGAMDAAGRIYAPERLHEVRIAVKKLRYALELAADARIAGAWPLVTALKRAQETLGRLNDLQALQRLVATVQAAPPAREGADTGALDAIAGALEEECRHLHARYCKQLPALLAVVETCCASPRATAAARRRLPATAAARPLKMLSSRQPRPAAARRAG